ncbi:hypothetical protein [Neisseria subflava]|uniref:hypothetical protein n=1 Tax=Neisseria subflava TaxID=28449 RepID=UPI001661685F|nr:hypothetical protein [Neisseria sp. KH1003-01]
MKTYPVMLPCHGGEDVEIASIAETEDGRCTILRNHIQTDNKAAALEIIRQSWPQAYIGESVRALD